MNMTFSTPSERKELWGINHGIADDDSFMPSKVLHEQGELRGV